LDIAVFVLTDLVMFMCIAAATLALAAYLVSRNRSYLFAMASFVFYFLDTSLIFLFEFQTISQNWTFDDLYGIPYPAVRIALAAGVLGSMWLLELDYFNARSRALATIPVVCFCAASTVWTLQPETPLDQWTFYLQRQLFMVWMVVYALWRYHRTESGIERTKIARHRAIFTIVATFAVLITLEDTANILFIPPELLSPSAHGLIYLSERNASECVMMIVLAVLCLRAAAKTLELRFDRTPKAQENVHAAQIMEDLVPSFAAEHGLTGREAEILKLVLLDYDNQNIASTYQIALGTVKAHVHNILKKTGSSTRQELKQKFWASK
jgi:DNA-binding CsgD family transcriptional regulator